MLNHYYTRCAELEIENNLEGNDPKRDEFWDGSEKQSASELRLRQAADLSRAGFQKPEMHDRQQCQQIDNNNNEALIS